MDRLLGKTAIISGASRGMGAAHAREFIRQGAKVVLTDTREAAGAALAEELGAAATFRLHDVTDSTGWREVVAHAEHRFGVVNILVNNAGILGPKSDTASLEDGEYHRVCAVNQHSVFLGMKTVIPAMLRAGGGSIVNVSSISGMVANYGFPSAAYVASKFAVRGMSKAVAIEYGARGIRVNSVHPGFIQTPMMVEGTDEDGGDATTLIPLRRIADPREVSSLVVFLASDESSYITGTEQVIDGGMTAQ